MLDASITFITKRDVRNFFVSHLYRMVHDTTELYPDWKKFKRNECVINTYKTKKCRLCLRACRKTIEAFDTS